MSEEGLSALEPARGAQTEEASHDDAEVESGEVDLVALEDVVPTSQVESSHSAGLAGVSETPLDGLAALAQEAFADVAFKSAAIEIGSLLPASGFSLADFSGKSLPVAAPLLPSFRDACVVSPFMQVPHHLAAVVSAIGHHLLDAASWVHRFDRCLGPRQLCGNVVVSPAPSRSTESSLANKPMFDRRERPFAGIEWP